MELTAMGLALGGNAQVAEDALPAQGRAGAEQSGAVSRDRVSPSAGPADRLGRRSRGGAAAARHDKRVAEEQDIRSGGIRVIVRAAELLQVLQRPAVSAKAEIWRAGGHGPLDRETGSPAGGRGLVASRGARTIVGPEITRIATTVRLGVVTEIHPFCPAIVSASWTGRWTCRSWTGIGRTSWTRSMPPAGALQAVKRGGSHSRCTAAPSSRHAGRSAP